MKKGKIVLSALALLTLCVSACEMRFDFGGVSFDSNSIDNNESSSIDEPSSSNEGGSPSTDTSSTNQGGITSNNAGNSTSNNGGSQTSSKNNDSTSNNTPSTSSNNNDPSTSSQPASQSTSSSSETSKSSSSSTSSSSSSNVPASGFKDINGLTSTIEIHTAAQKAYLSYDGNYNSMPTDQYPSGSDNISGSKALNVSWDYTVPAGKTVSDYSFVFGKESNLSDGYTINTTNKSLSFYNPYLGKNYYKLVANFSDNTKDETEILSFDVDGTYPRNLEIGGMTNCRDMGGRHFEDGGVMKQGLVYRTSGYHYDYSSEPTSAGITEMLQHLKFKTEVNVADGKSYNLNLSGTTVKNCLMDYGGSSAKSNHHFSRNAESVKNFFEILADSNNYPVFFHCRIGTDRTGLCAILLHGLLGATLNDVYQDYLFSNFGKIGEKRYIGAAAGQDNIENYIAEINAMSGETFHNKVYNMLLAIGLSKTTLNTIINNLTEGTKAQGNDAGQVIASADVLTGNGVSVSTDTTDRDNPDKYYVLNSTSKSVSYNFTASEAYRGQVVAYLGNSDYSSTKKIADAISCKIDSNSLTIKDQTYAQAGMGNCTDKNSNNQSYTRTNYYPVILGEMDISAGNHTITITGTSNSMNIAGIYIFDASKIANILLDDNPGGEGGEHTSHTYAPQTPVSNKAGKSVTTYLCSCGKKYLSINFTDYSSLSGAISSAGKIDNGSVIKWDFPAKAGHVTLQFNIKMSSDSNDHKNNPFLHEKYTIKMGGTSQTILLENNKTYSQLGFTTSGQYFDICTYDIDNDKNVEVEFDHNNSDYRLLFTGEVRLVYDD